MRSHAFTGCLALLLLSAALAAADAAVIDLAADAKAWTFGNGPEFPGAAGGLAVEAGAGPDGGACLRLGGDFAKGGNYVQAARQLDGIDPESIAFWLRDTAGDHVSLRLVDGSGQCHQIVLALNPQPGWQKVVLPVARFFALRGHSDAVTGIKRYESWGGAKDGQWHAPARLIALLVGRSETLTARTLDLARIEVRSRPAGAVASATAAVALDAIDEGEHDWGFNDGREFPGASGALTVLAAADGGPGLRLSGDFSKGGAYVSATRELTGIAAQETLAIRLKVRTANAAAIGIRLVDATGQCHQRKGVKLTTDGAWHDLVLRPTDIAGGEHWGGANDGRWHGPASHLAINIGKDSDVAGRKPVLDLAGVVAEVRVALAGTAEPFAAGFEPGQPAWVMTGDVAVEAAEGCLGAAALRLAVAPDKVGSACSAVGPEFAVVPGTWKISGLTRSELISPDASFCGLLALEILDAGGRVLDRVELAAPFGGKPWQACERVVAMPAGAVRARFAARIDKASGRFWVDGLAAAFLAPPDASERIARLLFGSAQVGNLLYPADPRQLTVTIEAVKALKDDERTVQCTVRDYWGAEQGPAIAVRVERTGRSGRSIRYEGRLDLDALPLAVGRYYEVHGAIARAGREPFANYSSFAILPEAVTRGFPALEVPFTARNWDNRIGEYIRLVSRIGIRTVGLWTMASPEKPDQVEIPGLDLAKQLGLAVLTAPPIAHIEHHQAGWEKWNEAAIRACTRAIIKRVDVRPLIFNLGNEPPEIADRVPANIAAYKAAYEEAKAADPAVYCVGSSAGTYEPAFAAGLGTWCDAYDFHIYEDSRNVRQALGRYRELFARHGQAKPVWSTELGLNSQGMARHAVAVELIRKFAVFFAAGGANVSWFGFLYPDTEGKNHASSGSAHNVFDCRFNRYCPKLDAVTYYHAVNAIAIKRFVAERAYPGGEQAFLFRDRDGRSLQVLWRDQGRSDVLVPLPGVAEVAVVRVDGRTSTLAAGGAGVTLTIDADPVLVLYQGGGDLAAALGRPLAGVAQPPAGLVRGVATAIEVALADGAAAELVAPPGWTVARSAVPGGVRLAVTVPEASGVREGDLLVAVTDAQGARRGELHLRPQVTGVISARLLPVPVIAGRPAGIRLEVENHGMQPQQVAWDLALAGQRTLAGGDFGAPAAPAASLAGSAEGALTIAGGATAAVEVPLAGVDPIAVYEVRGAVADAEGRRSAVARPMGGFAAVPHAPAGMKADGVLDEAAWASAPVQRLDQANQIAKVDKDMAPWKGPLDLSAAMRFLWDERYLYIAVQVTDDRAGARQPSDRLWAQDGLQFLVDPHRTVAEKTGKYDYAAGIGTQGPAAWCHLSGHPDAPVGAAPDIVVGAKAADDGSGAVTYELAVPWRRFAPFRPAPGANLGLTMILNEDDGAGRHGFMTWFGNAHTKQVDTVGDLVLLAP